MVGVREAKKKKINTWDNVSELQSPMRRGALRTIPNESGKVATMKSTGSEDSGVLKNHDPCSQTVDVQWCAGKLAFQRKG